MAVSVSCGIVIIILALVVLPALNSTDTGLSQASYVCLPLLAFGLGW